METIRQLEALWTYASRCAGLPASEPRCGSFWTAVDIAVVAIFALVALYILKNLARNLIAVRDEKRRAEEKARVADADTMARYKADLDKADLSREEGVEQRIRQALDDRARDPRAASRRSNQGGA